MHSIEGLSLKELKELACFVNDKISELEASHNLNDIVRKVDESNCAFNIKNIDDEILKPFGIHKTEFVLLLKVSTYDKEDKTDCLVDGLGEDQKDWVSWLKLNYEPNEDDEIELILIIIIGLTTNRMNPPPVMLKCISTSTIGNYLCRRRNILFVLMRMGIL